jgi:hypothetical protein
VVQFSDGVTTTIDLNQAPEGVAMQRVLAHGRTRTQWVQAVKAFVLAFATYFDGALVIKKTPPAPPPSGFLYRPWQAGVRVRHLAYFDHQYPTVDAQAQLYRLSSQGVQNDTRGLDDEQGHGGLEAGSAGGHDSGVQEPSGDTEDDKLRLFYVAITRAKRHLYLTSYQTKENG